MLILG
jgi:hypothetical protein